MTINRNLGPIFVAVSAKLIFAFLLLISCKNSKNTSKPTTLTSSNFQINCVILTKNQIQQWVDSGWTNPSNSPDTIKRLLLQPITLNPASSNSNLQLICYPAKEYNDVFFYGKHILKIDTTSVPLALSDTVIFANTYVRFKKLGITNPNGSLKDFDFIRFRPIKKFPHYISYEMEVVRLVGESKSEDIILKLSGGETADPCPPYCPIESD